MLKIFKKRREKALTFPLKTGIIRKLKDAPQSCGAKISRCRLAVWRQLPKLLPASSTLVTCSKIKVGCERHPTFILEIDRILTRVEGGAANESERFARSGIYNDKIDGKMDN